MAENTKQTSKAVASKASKILRDNRYSAKSKSVAGSALHRPRRSKFPWSAVTDNNQPAKFCPEQDTKLLTVKYRIT